MTINTLFMVLVLAVGAGTTQSIEPASTETENLTRNFKIATNCWINGVWYNPCPEDAPPAPMPEPSPEILLPN